jgi:hypothetical protein
MELNIVLGELRALLGPSGVKATACHRCTITALQVPEGACGVGGEPKARGHWFVLVVCWSLMDASFVRPKVRFGRRGTSGEINLNGYGFVCRANWRDGRRGATLAAHT